ncbi:hypothetical protein CBR_g50984 [Chara braunii]|uniref:Reverse transcriptase domain-containing protein n=1 Tax=Chara braunii TaxID=69332 RepID=A0A388M7S4_CHABU|nr:hypothetical protein CBR_g50984 [Chara braunii]|eukprot:GBG90638.1 hypothetical protein CBR_g50984 [Chara braunii]
MIQGPDCEANPSPSPDDGRGFEELEYEEEMPSKNEWKQLVELFEHETPEEFRMVLGTTRTFYLSLEDNTTTPTETHVNSSTFLGEPILQISDLADNLEPPCTLYEGTLSLQARYQQMKQFLDVYASPPRSLLMTGATIALIKREAEAPVDDVLDLMQEMVDLTGLTVEEATIDSETDVKIKETEMISPAESQMIATVSSVRTSSSVFCSVHDRRNRSTDEINVPLEIIDRPNVAVLNLWIPCPMGICKAPTTFQRAMNITFQNFVRKTRLAQNIINYCVIVYTDDILVYSSSYKGHVQHIEWVLHALRDAGFKAALEKKPVFLTTISFLGHVVTDQGFKPEPQKMAAVRDAPVPTTIMQVRAFSGLASYYRRFIKGFVAIARPLTNVLKKDRPLIWTPECDQAFSRLKVALISTPVLIRLDLETPFVLITDRQPEAISAILAQVGPNGLEHVVEYASKTVPACKCNYASPTGQCYAALWGISHFRAFLYGRKFTLVTDHEPLLALKKSEDYLGMIGR